MGERETCDLSTWRYRWGNNATLTTSCYPSTLSSPRPLSAYSLSIATRWNVGMNGGKKGVPLDILDSTFQHDGLHDIFFAVVRVFKLVMLGRKNKKTRARNHCERVSRLCFVLWPYSSTAISRLVDARLDDAVVVVVVLSSMDVTRSSFARVPCLRTTEPKQRKQMCLYK